MFFEAISQPCFRPNSDSIARYISSHNPYKVSPCKSKRKARRDTVRSEVRGDTIICHVKRKTDQHRDVPCIFRRPVHSAKQ